MSEEIPQTGLSDEDREILEELIEEESRKMREQALLNLEFDPKKEKEKLIQWAQTQLGKTPQEAEVYVDATFKIDAKEKKITVPGDLYLSGTSITSIPENLTSVEGNLDLPGTPVTSIPESLTSVGGNLGLYNTSVTSIPESLSIGGNVYIDKNQPELKKQLERLKQLGKIKGGMIEFPEYL